MTSTMQRTELQGSDPNVAIPVNQQEIQELRAGKLPGLVATAAEAGVSPVYVESTDATLVNPAHGEPTGPYSTGSEHNIYGVDPTDGTVVDGTQHLNDGSGGEAVPVRGAMVSPGAVHVADRPVQVG